MQKNVAGQLVRRYTSLFVLLMILVLGSTTGCGMGALEQTEQETPTPAATIALMRSLDTLPHEQTPADADEPEVTPPHPSPSVSAPVFSAVASSPTPAVAPSPTPTVAPSPTPTVAPSPTPTVAPSPTPTAPIVGYRTHTVATGEDIAVIALNGGSSPAVIEQYNHLTVPPNPGCPLIVPHLAGQMNVLSRELLLVQQGCSAHPFVALTLDAGAGSEPTAAILKALREREIQITFFLTGDWIVQNPELTRQMVADGHEVGNHSLSHPDFTTLTAEEMIVQMQTTERIFQETTGASLHPFFRPPYGAYNREVLMTVIDQGYLPIYWTLDSLDSVGEPKTADFLLKRVTQTLAPVDLRNAIILAHCGSAATAEALPAILDTFAAMGFEVRPLSNVLQ
jgi:peptidoglycan/xylan/chitin deacetylase (PgdA/CDA1 family)